MPQLLLKSGLLLIAAAGIFIAVGFFIFVFCAAILLAPGFLLYKAGLKSLFNNMATPANAYNANNPKMIDVTPENPSADFANKGKKVLKSAARKIGNFLNKYAD